MNAMTAPPLSQPSLGSDFEAKSCEQVIAETIDAMFERGEDAQAIAIEVARIMKAFEQEDDEPPSTGRAALCPKCHERIGFKVIRSSWLDAGKSRERICRNPKCRYFFRTFESFPKL
jgi:hypothetical protein